MQDKMLGDVRSILNPEPRAEDKDPAAQPESVQRSASKQRKTCAHRHGLGYVGLIRI